MKKVFGILFVALLPLMAAVVFNAVLQGIFTERPAPLKAPATASMEAWYAPWTWSADEVMTAASTEATQLAQAAQDNAVSYSSAIMWVSVTALGAVIGTLAVVKLMGWDISRSLTAEGTSNESSSDESSSSSDGSSSSSDDGEDKKHPAQKTPSQEALDAQAARTGRGRTVPA